MSKIKNYTLLQQTERGNFDELRKYAGDFVDNKITGTERKDYSSDIWEIIDAANANESFREEFSRAFSNEYGKKVEFKALNSDEKAQQAEELKKYEVTAVETGASYNPISGLIETSLIPTVESLVRDDSLLSKVQMTNLSPMEFKKMYDFNVEKDAAVLAETAPGVDVDDTVREGDTLIPNKKIQASTQIHELAIRSLDATELGIFVARIPRRIRYTAITQMLYGNDNNQWRGIKNTAGTNEKNTIGALTPTLSGVGIADHYDACVYAKEATLPSLISAEDESKYSFIMNRKTWAKIRRVRDLNGRYQLMDATAPGINGVPVRQIDGTPVEIYSGIADDEIFLIPLTSYVIVTTGGLLNYNDGGILKLREGFVLYVSRMYSDGSPRSAFKYKSSTAAVTGTTAFDNFEQNAWRVFSLLASYV